MEPNLEQIFHYLGAGARADDALRRQVLDVIQRIPSSIQPRYVYRVLEVGEFPLSGDTARTMLADCRRMALLCCTLGAQFDALLRRAQAGDMARAVILDAWGSAMVETGCDAAEGELAARFPHLHLTDRFSPGYGDLPLTVQSDLCAALDARRRLGVQVTDCHLLNPGKSVTAVIGLSHTPQKARIRGCDFCSMGDTCPLRKGGSHCVSI